MAEELGVYVSLYSIVTEESPGQEKPGGRNRCKNYEGMLLIDLPFSLPSYTTQDHLPKVSPSTVSQALTHQPLVKTMSTDLPTRQSDGSESSTEVLSLFPR